MRKESLIAFIVAFALTVAFSFISTLSQVVLANAYQGSLTASSLGSTLIHVGGFAVFFAAFYFLVNSNKISAVKLTAIASFLGVLIGSSIPYILSVFSFTVASIDYVSIVVGIVLANVFFYFLPALTGLLFATLGKKKSNFILPAEQESFNPT